MGLIRGLDCTIPSFSFLQILKSEVKSEKVLKSEGKKYPRYANILKHNYYRFIHSHLVFVSVFI